MNVPISQVPLFKFEQRKLSYKPEGTEYGIEKDCEESRCTDMECRSDVRMAEAIVPKVMIKESISGLEIVQLIIAELRKNGKFFILPMNDVTAVEAITKAFRLLLDIGKMDISFLLLTS